MNQTVRTSTHVTEVSLEGDFFNQLLPLELTVHLIPNWDFSVFRVKGVVL